MRNHFNTVHRWSYIIVPVVGGGHRHYFVSDIVDENSLYSVQKTYDSKYDGYLVSNSSLGNFCSLYELAVVVDKSEYYISNNIVNSDSLYVIYNEVDYNR